MSPDMPALSADSIARCESFGREAGGQHFCDGLRNSAGFPAHAKFLVTRKKFMEPDADKLVIVSDEDAT